MDMNPIAPPPAAPRTERQLIGRVISVTGSTARIELTQDGSRAPEAMRATVGKFIGILSTNSIIVGMVTEISEQPRLAAVESTSAAHLDLFGAIKTAGSSVAFSRGVTEYPAIGHPAMLLNDRELRLVYGSIA